MEQSEMLPPDREREWSNFSGKSKVLITPLKLFLAVLILTDFLQINFWCIAFHTPIGKI